MGGKGSRTGRDARRRVYGQNFLASRAVAAQLARDAQVLPGDFVLELGAGGGILTGELARRAERVCAVEIDPVWASRLRARFGGVPRVEVVEADWFRLPLPTRPFRVVANVPFGATTRLLHRLLDDPSLPLQRADLVLQWQVARKRAGRPRTSASAAWSPWWRFRLGRRLPCTAFRPVPRVDGGVLTVERRPEPLLPVEARRAFASFAHGLFTGSLAPELDADQWARMFAAFSGPAGGDAP